MVIEPRLGEEIDHRSAGAGLGIRRTVDDPRDPRVEDRTGTHRARLDRHVEVAARQPVIAEGAAGVAQRRDLGMRRRIGTGDRRVAAAADDDAFLNDDSAHRNLATRARRARQRERLAHPVVLSCHQSPASKRTIATQFPPFPVGYRRRRSSAPLAASMA